MLHLITRFLALAIALNPLTDGQENSGQKTKNRPSVSNSNDHLFVGQPIKEAVSVLRARNINYNNGTMAMNVEEGAAYFTFSLDKNRAFACVFYSKTTREIVELSVVFFPHRDARQKIYRSWVAANKVRLHSDGSYSVHFVKPRTEKQEQSKNNNSRRE